MFVLKRSGTKEEVDTVKIKSKIEFFIKYLFPLKGINVEFLLTQVELGLHNSILTSDIDVFTARKCLELATQEPEYEILASRILIDNHHKNTLTSFRDKMDKLYRRVDIHGKIHPLIDRTFFKFVCTNQRRLESMIDYERDYLLDSFGFLTLENQYLTKIDNKVIERPQDIFMREAIALCYDTFDFKSEDALQEINYVYDLLSTKKYTYATPTLNNSGMVNQQLSSCYLLGSEDSLEGINKTMNDAAKISKEGGGIGIDVSMWRSEGSQIRGTNGKSSGIKNFLKIYDATANAYNQGGKRKGSFAVYLRDYHPDLLKFIAMKNPIGDENSRAKNLFYAVCLSDKFWKSVENNDDWYFINPDVCEELSKLYGDEFEKVYEELVKKEKYSEKMNARLVLEEIMKNQFESGVPYILNFDHVNRKNNLKNYSPITTSNLCIEITLPATQYEYGVCNLSSLVLPSFVVEKVKKTIEPDYVCTLPPNKIFASGSRLQGVNLRTPVYSSKKTFENPEFDFDSLATVVRIVTRTMDRVIDRNSYPVPEAMLSNLIHRPIGIGTSGFADVCCMLRIPFDSEEGVILCKRIYETIAYASLTESCHLAKLYRKRDKNGDFLNQEEKSKKIFELFESSKRYSVVRKQINKLLKRTDYDPKELEMLTLELSTVSNCMDVIQDIVPLAKSMSVYPSYYYSLSSDPKEKAPISQGEFQWKMWGLEKKDLSGMWDWETLEEKIKKFGVRNSLLTAQMPTASTSQIMGVNESCEPFTTNIYRRSVLSGEYVVFNKYLIEELKRINLWSEDFKSYLIASNGSVQNITGVPEYIKELFKTAWEIPHKRMIEHAVAKGPFLDHSQSFNVFIGNNIDNKADVLYRVLYSGWKRGLKTGIYYLRTQPAISAQQFTTSLKIQEQVSSGSLNVSRGNSNVEERKLGSLQDVEQETCLNCGT